MDKVELILRKTENNIISERILVSSDEADLFSTDSDKMTFPGLEILCRKKSYAEKMRMGQKKVQIIRSLQNQGK